MRSRIWIGSLMLLTTMAAAGCSSVVDPATPTSGQDARVADSRGADGSVVRGRVVYEQNCVTCHGPRGKGDGPNAYQCTKPPSNLCDADVAESSPKALLRKVSNGGSGMPAFRRLLSEQDRSDVVEYVRTLSPSRSAGRQQEADSHF